MIKTIPIKKFKDIDLSKYVNIETGEPLSEELKEKNTAISVEQTTNTSIVSYSDYSVISTEAVEVLIQILNNSDFANVIKMAVIVKTPLSILFNGNIPHNHETLQKYLEIKSEAMYMGLIKRLMNIGVLYQISGKIYGMNRKIYIINPYICRKRRIFENQILEMFQQFKKDDFKQLIQ